MNVASLIDEYGYVHLEDCSMGFFAFSRYISAFKAHVSGDPREDAFWKKKPFTYLAEPEPEPPQVDNSAKGKKKRPAAKPKAAASSKGKKKKK